MTRLDAIQYLLDNAEQTTIVQKVALLEVIQNDVMTAPEYAFDMTDVEIEAWLDECLKFVAKAE